LDPDRTLFDQSSELPYDTAFEFPRDKLTFIKSLGKGAFGEVWLAEAEGITGKNFLLYYRVLETPLAPRFL